MGTHLLQSQTDVQEQILQYQFVIRNFVFLIHIFIKIKILDVRTILF
jgi:hypothetical protein